MVCIKAPEGPPPCFSHPILTDFLISVSHNEHQQVNASAVDGMSMSKTLLSGFSIKEEKNESTDAIFGTEVSYWWSEDDWELHTGVVMESTDVQLNALFADFQSVWVPIEWRVERSLWPN